MKKIFITCFLVFVFGCGTTSKKLKDMKPLGTDDPVQMFWSTPNLKYDPVCLIEAHGNNTLVMAFLKKEDFTSIFEKEARKCGADGVVYQSMSAISRGDMIAYGTGIKIRSKTSALNVEKIKTFSIAVRDRDQQKAQDLIRDIPKKRDERAPSDDELINIGLYLTTIQGFDCEDKMVDLLQNQYEGRVPEFAMVKSFDSEHQDSDTPYCKTVMAKSLPQMDDAKGALTTVEHYYRNLISGKHGAYYKKKVQAYHDLLTEASKLIQRRCSKSATDPVCALKANYVKFATEQQKSQTKNVKMNATDVLSILK
jgi:hypothetical protein